MAKVGLPDHYLASLMASATGKKTETKKDLAKTTGRFKHLVESEAEAAFSHSVQNLPFSDEAISELLAAVHSGGDALKKDATPANIVSYKKAVRDFMHYVVEHSYAVAENTSGRNILKRKKYTNVAVIDEKLERLAADIMVTQRDKLDILARLDEIYGLLVDLLS